MFNETSNSEEVNYRRQRHVERNDVSDVIANCAGWLPNRVDSVNDRMRDSHDTDDSE